MIIYLSALCEDRSLSFSANLFCILILILQKSRFLLFFINYEFLSSKSTECFKFYYYKNGCLDYIVETTQENANSIEN